MYIHVSVFEDFVNITSKYCKLDASYICLRVLTGSVVSDTNDVEFFYVTLYIY